jgi:hypothetical protein
LHVFTVEQLAAMAQEAGYRRVHLSTSDFLSTLVLTASYVAHGRRPGLARHMPWRGLETAAATVDGLIGNRLLPERLRHTVVGVLQT